MTSKDPNPRRKIYDAVTDKGIYTKSFEDFEKQFESPKMAKALYGVLTDESMTKKGLGEFIDTYYGDQYTVEDESVVPISQKKSPVGSSDSGDGSSTVNAQSAATGGSAEDLINKPFGESGEGVPFVNEPAAPTVDLDPREASIDPLGPQDDTAPGDLGQVAGLEEGTPMTPDGQGGFTPQEEEKIRNPIKSMFKSAWNTLAYQLPASMAAAATAISKPGSEGTMYLTPTSVSPHKSYKRTPEDEKKLKEMGMASSKELLSWALERNQKGAEAAKGLIQHYNQISDPIDAINYVFSAVGQGLPQIATTVASGGVSGIGQSIGGIYMDEVEKLATKYNISPEEVIDNNLDDPATAVAFGALAGSVDYVGASSLLGGLKKKAVDKALRGRAGAFLKAAKGFVTEGVTEATQSVIEQSGAALGADEKVDINWKDTLNEGLVGALSGGSISSVGQTVNSIASKGEKDVTVDKVIEAIKKGQPNVPEAQITKSSPKENNAPAAESKPNKPSILNPEEELGAVAEANQFKIENKEQEITLKPEYDEFGDYLAAKYPWVTFKNSKGEVITPKPQKQSNREGISDVEYDDTQATEYSGPGLTGPDNQLEGGDRLAQKLGLPSSEPAVEEKADQATPIPEASIPEPATQLPEASVPETGPVSTISQAVAEEKRISDLLNPTEGMVTPQGKVSKVEDGTIFIEQEDGQVVEQSIDDYREGVKADNEFKANLSNEETALVDRMSGNIAAQPSKPAKKNKAIEKVKKALSNIGDFEVIEHDSNESIQQVARDAGLDLTPEDTVGGIRIGNQIHINTKDAKDNTLAHEATHPILEAAASNKINDFYAQIQKLPEYEALKDIESRYEGDEAKKEVVTEFISQVASGEIKTNDSLFQKIKDLFTSMLDSVGLGGKIKLDSEQDVVAFAKSVSRALNKGKAIEAQASSMSVKPEAQLLEKQSVLRAREIVQEFAPRVGPGLTEATLIREVSREMGVPLDQVQDMVTAARRGAKKSFYDPSMKPGFFNQKIAAPIKNFHSRWLSSRKGAPKIAIDLKNGMNGAIIAEMDLANRKVLEVQKLAKKKGVTTDQIEDFLRGVNTNIDPDVANVLAEMRGQIDKLSQLLIDEGYVFGEGLETVKANLGKYLTRTYRLYLDPSFTPTKAVQENAARYFASQYFNKYREQNPNATNAEVQAMALEEGRGTVAEILAERDLPKKWKSSIGRDSKNLNQRKNIDPRVRELLGEYSHPLEAYAWTVYRLSNLFYGTKMLSDLQAVGLGKFLFTKGDPRNPKPPEASVKLSGKNSDAFFPLNVVNEDGLMFDPSVDQIFTKKEIFTTPEVFEAITDSQLRARSWQDSMFEKFKVAMLSDMSGGINTLNGWVNWGKTVGSPGTHVKNVLGNIPFLLSNGYIKPHFLNFNAGSFKEAWQTVLVDNGLKFSDTSKLSGQDKIKLEEVNRQIEYLKSNGVIGQNVAIGVIKDLMDSRKSPAEFFEAHLNKKRNIPQRIKKGALKFKDILDKAYGAEDDIFKIFAFTVETNQYAKAIYGKKYSDLTDSQRSEVDAIASTIVKNVLPNYGMLGDLAKSISRSPWIGNFIAFRVESFRVSYNSVKQAMDEIASDNPQVKKIGAARLIGTTEGAALRASLVAGFGKLAGIGLQGIVGAFKDNEEEEDKQKAMRSYLYPWLKTSDVVAHQVDNGVIRIHDFSGVDPYNSIQRIINAGLHADGDPSKPIVEIFGGFVDETILLNAAINVGSGIDNYERRIWYPGDDMSTKVAKSAAHLGRTLSPGVYNTSVKIYESGGDPNTIAGQFLGATYYEIDVPKSYYFKLQDWIKPESGMRKKYRNEARLAAKSEDQKWMDSINAGVVKELDKMREYYEDAIKLGVSARELIQIMKDSRLDKDDIKYIRGEEFKPWTIGEYK